MNDTQGPAAPALELESAIAIADANEASGFEAPPHIQAVIDEAGPAQVKAARKAMDARRKAAEAEAAKAAKTTLAEGPPTDPPVDDAAGQQTDTPPAPDADAQPKE